MAHRRDGDLLRVGPMKAVPELLTLGEWIRPPKKSVMNSKVPRRPISLKEKPPDINRSLSTLTTSEDQGTIRTSGRKVRCEFTIIVCQLSVFFAPANYGLVKIARCSSEVLL
jgi:hypothetical protein